MTFSRNNSRAIREYVKPAKRKNEYRISRIDGGERMGAPFVCVEDVFPVDCPIHDTTA